MTSRTEGSAVAAPQSVVPARPRAGFRHGFGSLVVRISDALLAWQERARQRYRLEGLDDRMLKDIGVSRADIDRVVNGTFRR